MRLRGFQLLVLLAVVAVVLSLGTELPGRLGSAGSQLSVIQRLAVERTRDAQAHLYTARDARLDAEQRAELERTDIHRSGLVGLEWTPLVTTAGNYEAKLLSTDPLWAALFIDWFDRAGLVAGDSVAIGSSGSFPGLMLSARIAAETAALVPRVAGSLGASNFGATIPEFDLYEMDKVLHEASLLEHPAILWSPGGGDDLLLGLDDEDRARALARLASIQAAGTETLIPETLTESIEVRDSRLLRPDTKLFVNIGGHSANYGVGMTALRLPSGYIPASQAEEIFPAADSSITDSVALRALRGGVPVLNLIELKHVLESERVGFTSSGLRLGGEKISPTIRAVSGLCFLILAAILWITRKQFKPIGECT